MFKKIFPTYIRKHFATIIICILLLLVLFNLFFHVNIFEGIDPTAAPPYVDSVGITMQDTTKTEEQIDPEALGKYYISTDTNSKIKSTFIMSKTGAPSLEPSIASLQFDLINKTNIIIYPIQITPTDSHKANIFPPNFTLSINFPLDKKKYTIANQDLSSNTSKNMLINYTVPDGSFKGNFMKIVYANSIMQTPIYADETPQSSMGSVDASVKGTFKIKVNSNGNKISGFLINLNPPK
jgi:hypothetical protein